MFLSRGPQNTMVPMYCASTESNNENKIIIPKERELSLLLLIDLKKPSGPDLIPNEFWRRCCEWVSEYFLKIFTPSLRECAV